MKKGYMTVEMSMVFPIVFFVICSIFYMSFYYHDVIVAKSNAMRICVGQCESHTSTSEVEQKVKDIERRLIIANIREVEYQKNSEKIKIKFVLNVNMPVVVHSNIRKNISASINDYVAREFILKIKMLKELKEGRE